MFGLGSAFQVLARGVLLVGLAFRFLSSDSGNFGALMFNLLNLGCFTNLQGLGEGAELKTSDSLSAQARLFVSPIPYRRRLKPPLQSSLVLELGVLVCWCTVQLCQREGVEPD